MSFYQFIRASKKQDQKNIYKRTSLKDKRYIQANIMEKSLRDFYWTMYPEDVELLLKDGSLIMLFPLYQLMFLQQIYQCGGYFAFCLWDGDPVCIRDDKVYVLKKIGVNKWCFTEIADSLEVFLEAIISKLINPSKVINFTGYKNSTGTSG